MCAPEGRRLRRRPRDGGRSAGPVSVGAATGAGGASTTGFGVATAPDGLRRRLRDRVAVVSAGPGAARGTPRSLRRTLAPISPSAQSVPSPLNTSTRQTTVPIVEAGKGGRFCVRVQRAEMVSPAWTAFGNFQLAHPHSATSATGVSMDPSPIAAATTNVGGANRTPCVAPASACGDKSEVIPENRAMSASVMVRPRVVHSPPSGSSSNERGCRSGRV